MLFFIVFGVALLQCGFLREGFAASFSQQPVDRDIISGQSVTLPCVVVGYKGIVQWTKDGLALGGERDLPGWSRYSITGDGSSGEYNLRIESAELEDDAVYECQATQAALRSQKAKLNVLIPPGEPVIENGPVVKLKADTPYNLTCKAPGAKPAAEITWYRDGERQDTAIYSKEVMPDGKRENAVSMLLITPTSKDSERQFICNVTNRAAPAGKQTKVTLNVLHPPTVTLSVQPQTVLEGVRVKFLCTARANPEVTGFRWAKGGVPIPEANGDSYEAVVDHTFFTEPVSCEVSNIVGSTNISTLVDVHFGPRLISEPKPLTVDVGNDAGFTCNWAGNPPLTLAWTKKGSSVVLSNGNTLQLKSVTQEDAGIYICKAIVPRIGVAEKEVTLTVNGPPIITASPTQYAGEGDKARIACHVRSTPAPEKIVWIWGENTLDAGSSGRFTVNTVSTDGGVTSDLIISETREKDFQVQYNCTAWNRFGLYSAIITLKKEDSLPLMIIISTAVGAGVAIIIFLLIIILLCCRNSKKADLAKKGTRLSKSDIRVQIVDSDHSLAHNSEEEDVKEPMAANSDSPGTSRTEHSNILEEEEEENQELKDPTNGYYNVRAHEERHVRSGFSEYVPTNSRQIYTPPHVSHNTIYPPGQSKLYEYSHRYALPAAGCATYDTHERIYPQETIYGGSSYLSAPYTRAFSNYVKPSNYDKTESYEHSDQASKVSSSSRFSYTSLSQNSDYGRPTQQRMQTHV
ncbi:kin of IRRE-like protein 2 [Protopterus annectens]|uniref:kin of IRRE-like protein 2 n=1 Tax=Protopterus annectens TaxID=7888 RepID=UPI001CFB8552|nr:kin of IRRE-like protein 2 [Protopterus annectens]